MNSRGEAEASDGRVLIVAFRDGQPAAGVSMNASFGTLKTRPDGTFTADLRPGTYRLDIPELNERIEFQVVASLETQLTVNLLSGAKGTLAVAHPEALNTAQTVALGPLTDAKIQVLNEQNRAPISGATVMISGQSDVLTTDAEGMTTAKVPEGEYSISVFHPQFQTRTLSGLRLVQALSAPIKVELKTQSNELEDVVVLAPKVKGSVSALVEVRRRSSAVTDVLGSEQMARAGDSDAAASLRRVTGLTLMGGKYVYVRGLGERYSGVQMNGFGLPSPEPARRVVPLDLFPVSILESIVVQKSYSPDLPAEFGGGIIQLQTRSLPDKAFVRASLSSSYEENTDNRLNYRGGSMDWLGMDDGTRKLPSAIRNALASGKKLVRKQSGSPEGMSEQELTALGRSLPNNYNTDRASQPNMPGLSLAMGNRYSVAGKKTGVAASLLYGQNMSGGERLNRGFNVGSGNRLVRDFEETQEFAETETRLAGSLDLGVELGKGHQITASTFLLRHTTNFVQAQSRVSESAPNTTLESTTLDWTERQLWTKHLNGKHDLNDWIGRPVVVQWRAGLSDALRDSPDRREYAYERTATSYQMRSDSGGNRRTFSELVDASQEYGADLSVPLTEDPERWKIKVGTSYLQRDRRSDVFRLFFAPDFTGPGPVSVAADPETRFAADNIGPGGFMLQNLTDAADSYKGAQNVFAYYAMTEFNPTAKWTFSLGARQERSMQEVSTFRYFDPNTPFSQSRLEMNNLLPAYSAVWKPSERWRARLAYSETLARPDFRELSTVGFIDDETGNEVIGNAALKGTVIRNIDHRWEYYLTTDEYVSLGGFYKRFENPIEVMFQPGVNRIQTFDNAQAAQNYGLEFESRIGLRHATRAQRRWSVLGNLTLIESAIQLDERNRGIQTSSERPLQGQSPYVANFQLQYDRPLWGFSATLLYNVVGERITEVGTNQVPDTYEQPVHQVDFVASKSFDKTYTLALRAGNLLDPVIESRQGDEVVRAFRRGRMVGLSLGAVF